MGLFVMQHFTDEDVVSPPGLRRGLFTVGDIDNIDHNTSSTTSAEYFLWHCYIVCFKHVLPWPMGRRETYLWFQAVMAKLLFLLNIPLSAVDGWSEVSPSRICGFQGTGPNFFAIASTMSNSSSISRGK